MFTIGLKGIKVHAPVGYYDWERKEGREFYIDLEFVMNREEVKDDEIQNTFNYEIAYKIVTEQAKKEVKLIETFMANIIEQIRKENLNSDLINVKIKMKKLDPFKNSMVEAAIIERTYEL